MSQDNTLTQQPSVFAGIRWDTLLTRLVSFAILLVMTVLFTLPFIWMVMTSFKDPTELMFWPPEWIPRTWKWSNYPDALAYFPFFLYLRNTLVVTLLSIIGVLVSCPPVAYGFSHINWLGRDTLFMVMLMTLMIPFPVTMLPLYIIYSKLGWINSFLPLIVPTFFGAPFFIFLLRQFFMTVPTELTDAARIDGASEPRIYAQLILPLVKPALATVVLFQFLSSWSAFLQPLLYLRNSELFTIALGLRMFQAERDTEFHLLMAASTVLTVPVIILFFLVQRTFIQGITLTGLKGA